MAGKSAIDDLDFLDAISHDFNSLTAFTDYIKNDVELENLGGDLNIIGSVADFPDSKTFIKSLNHYFDIIDARGSLLLLRSKNVPYYVFLHGQFPIFFTTGTKTEEIPETLDEYILGEKNMSRMWVSRREMEDIRQVVVEQHPDILMPYFSAKRGAYSDIEAKLRPDVKRTFIYHGDDGLKTFSELREQYGVLPNNMKFEKANHFKFRVSTKGVFTIKNGGLDEALSLIKNSIETLTNVKESIDDSGYTERDNKYVGGVKIPQSRPWVIKLERGLTETDVRSFKKDIEMDEWDFSVSKFRPNYDTGPKFSSIIVDTNDYSRTDIKGEPDSIRVYPRKSTGIGQSLRIFKFVNEQIDPSSYTTTV